MRLAPVVTTFVMSIFCMGMLQGAHAQQSTAASKITILTSPAEDLEALWMADSKGYFAAEGLQVEFKQFPSGSTALQSFKAGAGDLVFSGELPALSYWENNEQQYRIVTLLNRNTKVLSAVVDKSVSDAKGLVGKTIATRVGSTGSWFISEYLRKNGVSEDQVKVRNLDGQVMVAALCKGDIDGIFIWYPIGQIAQTTCPDKVHVLTTGEGYIRGYSVVGARPSWLGKPGNMKALEGFLRAALKGSEYGRKNFQEVADYLKTKFGLPEQMAKFSWDVNQRQFGFDETFHSDFCQMAAWMKSKSLLKTDLDFSKLVDARALNSVAPHLSVAAPKTCGH